jgi:hypothetical protein
VRQLLRLSVVIAAAAASCVVPLADAHAATVKDTVPLRWTLDGAVYSMNHPNTVVTGSHQSTHARPNGAHMVVHTTGLRPFHAYTLWFTFFNHPEHCQHAPSEDRRCGLLDLFNEMTDGSLVFGDGAVADAWGNATFEGYRPVGEVPVGEEQIAHGTGILTNPLGAEYQATLRSHGIYDPAAYGDEQITTLNGGCHVERGEKYLCTDDQASGFRAQL